MFEFYETFELPNTKEKVVENELETLKTNLYFNLNDKE